MKMLIGAIQVDRHYNYQYAATAATYSLTSPLNKKIQLNPLPIVSALSDRAGSSFPIQISTNKASHSK